MVYLSIFRSNSKLATIGRLEQQGVFHFVWVVILVWRMRKNICLKNKFWQISHPMPKHLIIFNSGMLFKGFLSRTSFLGPLSRSGSAWVDRFLTCVIFACSSASAVAHIFDSTTAVLWDRNALSRCHQADKLSIGWCVPAGRLEILVSISLLNFLTSSSLPKPSQEAALSKHPFYFSSMQIVVFRLKCGLHVNSK